MSAHDPGQTHAYRARVVWEGNTGTGTASYDGYRRECRVFIDGKPALEASADASFRGDPRRHNPEDLFLSAIATCHMLAYLALCARAGVRVLAYEDAAEGLMQVGRDGGGRFTAVTLRPQVLIAADGDRDKAANLHGTAHARCFIANSCRVPIGHEATVTVAEAGNRS